MIGTEDFEFIVSNAGASWFGTLSCTFIPVNPVTNEDGEIEFMVVGDTSIIGGISIEVIAQGIPINDIDILECKSMDYDLDGDVDLADFILFGQDWGSTEWRSDFDWDGDVDLSDFIFFGQHWGHS